MDDLVTFELVNKSAAPWGILTEVYGTRSIPIVWLTENSPRGFCDKNVLSARDIQIIQYATLSGIIKVEGLEFQFDAEREQEAARIARMQEAQRISDTIFKEQKIAEPPKKAEIVYPAIKDLLSKHAATVKRDLTLFAKQGVSIQFLRKCREEEESGKNRKSVVGLILSLIESRLCELQLTGGLDDEYYNMITIEYDDEEDEILESPPV